jgi:hypothetical protein
LAASHWIDLAARAVPHPKPYYRAEAVTLLKSTSLLFLQSVRLIGGVEHCQRLILH